MSGSYSVTPAELGTAGSAVGRDVEPIASAASGVAGTSGAAAGTPAAGSYATLIDDATKSLSTIHQAVDDLAGALTQAASNYEQTEGINRSGLIARLR